MSSPFIQLEDVSFTYASENNRVLKTLSLEIEKGEISAVLGPNGIGKTTLLLIVLGWIKPDSGILRLKGKNIHDYSRKEMGRIIGLVPQDEHIAFEYSLLEYVLLGRAPHLNPLESPGRSDVEAAMAALERVGLTDLAERPVTHLSGGEKQLVLAARSLAQEPEILLMDEPMSNLDLANKIKLIRVMETLREEGVTILFTSHEPEIASAISSYVVLMGKNSNVLHGKPDEVLTENNLEEVYGVPINISVLNGRRVIHWL